MTTDSFGFDKDARLAEDRRAQLAAEEIPLLQPAFPHVGIPFDPEPFGAIPSDQIEEVQDDE